MTRSRRAGAAIMFAVLAAGCTSTTGGASGPALPYKESRGPAGTVPTGLERFYGQKLTWENCKDYASSQYDAQPLADPDVECTHLTVPLDYAKPDGDTIRVGVLRKPAKSRADRIGSLLVNPGGPGVAGLATAVNVSDANDTLANRFDFVGFDPRGVGSSEPTVECLTDAETDAERADDVELDTSSAGTAENEQEAKGYVAKCAKRTDHGTAMLANVGTRDVVRDLDVLRSALGDEKLTYVGFSYGTRIGSEYAEEFPDNVRALVLDGAVDPTMDAADAAVAQAKGFQEAFDDFVAWCADQDDCAFDTADPAKASTQFQELVRPLADHPIDVGGRPLSYEDATTGVIQALYTQQLWEHLNSGLDELRHQHGETLMTLADLYMERDSDGTYSTTQDAFNAIHCVDDARVTDRDAIRSLNARYKQAAPFLDDGHPPGTARDVCAFWPVPPTSDPALPKVEGLPPVLVVSTTHDPATPYQAGVALAKALGGEVLTYVATQHTVFLQGNKCVDDAGATYLTDVKLPPAGTRCKP